MALFLSFRRLPHSLLLRRLSTSPNPFHPPPDHARPQPNWTPSHQHPPIPQFQNPNFNTYQQPRNPNFTPNTHQQSGNPNFNRGYHNVPEDVAGNVDLIGLALEGKVNARRVFDHMPDAKFAEVIRAVPRSDSGKKISAQERKSGRVPSIVFEQKDGQYGGHKRLISVQTNQIKKLVNQLGRSFFLSRVFDLEVRPDFDSDEVVESVRVLPRQIHLHAGTDAVLNVTFIRAPSDALLKVDIPIVFRGEDVSPGIKKGSYLNVIKRTVKFLCPADIIPPYIDVDLSELDAGQKIVMGDLIVHPALQFIRPKDEPVVKIMTARVSDQKKSK